jgi:hypothetical protein
MNTPTDYPVTDDTDAAENLTATLANHAANATHVIADQLTAAAKSAAGFVKSSPWQAAGAVALVGLAAGMLVSRGARSRRRVRAEKFDSSPEVVGG